jgi:hypothetical protein
VLAVRHGATLDGRALLREPSYRRQATSGAWTSDIDAALIRGLLSDGSQCLQPDIAEGRSSGE